MSASEEDYGEDFLAEMESALMGGGVPLGEVEVGESQVYNDVWKSTDGGTWAQQTADAGFVQRVHFGLIVFGGGLATPSRGRTSGCCIDTVSAPPPM